MRAVDQLPGAPCGRSANTARPAPSRSRSTLARQVRPPDPPEVSDATVWGPRNHGAEVARPGHAVLLDLDSPRHGPLVREGPAAVIWDCLGESNTASRACEEVAARFVVPVDEIAGAVHDFIEEMAGCNLLSKRGGNG
jgi:hypothetical protein